MTAARRKRIEEVFGAASDLEAGDLPAFLDKECADDPQLREEVESLLAVDSGRTLSIQRLVRSEAEHLATSRREALIGQVIGPYRVTSLLGHGGMGTVYLAEQQRDGFQRRVALKLISRGMDSQAFIERFRRECRILANLDHMYIAGFIDAGSTPDGQSFFVMEYVAGKPLMEYVAEHKLGIDEKLELFRRICEAVQYAHRNLVVHRDLKPGNILVTADGVPKLLDFGLAKLMSEDPLDGGLTHPTSRILTPAYASPEQIRGDAVNTATDIYSLGVILYELLTGRLPHDIAGKSWPTVERDICEQEPAAPSTHDRRLRGDLDNIVLKALHKDTVCRYLTVEQFSEDVSRYLRREPVLARKTSALYRVKKFVRRHRVGASLAAVAILSLIVVTTLALSAAKRATQRYEKVRRLANVLLYDFGDRVRFVPGTLDARAVMVETGLRYLEELANETGTDTMVNVDLARAYERFGGILGSPDPGDPDLGKPGLAMENYQKALATLQRLPRAASQHPGIALIRCKIHIAMGALAEDPAEARRHLEESLRWNERVGRDIVPILWPQALPPFREFLRHQAKAWLSLVATADGDPELGVELAGEAGPLFANGCRNTALAYAGNLGEAIRTAAAGRIEIEQRMSLSPKEDILKRAFRLGHARMSRAMAGHLGNPFQMNLGRTEEARKAYESAIAYTNDILVRQPDDEEALASRALDVAGLASVISDAEPERAVQLYRQALRMDGKFHMSRRYWGATLGDARWQISYPLRRLGQEDEAAEYARAAVKQEASPAARAALGDALRDIGDPAGAREQYRLAADNVQRLVAQKPKNMPARAQLADLYRRLGELSVRTRDLAAAKAWFTKELEVWTTWEKHGVSNSFRERQLVEATRRLGRLGA